jgi:hypothetical protein
LLLLFSLLPSSPMKKLLVVLLLLNVAHLPAAFAQAGGSHEKAAEQMLELMNMEMVLTQSVDEMLKAQMQANPAIAPYEDVMRKFFAKHMSWSSLKPDMVKIYTEAFTEKELNELNAFYQTPTGKKAVQSMPVLMGKGAQVGSQRVQQNMPELQAAIAAEAKKQDDAKKK